MREVLAALRDFANPFSILTKGTLIVRDLDLLTQAAEVTRVGLSMSIGFVDETLWRSVEPGTPSPRRRLDAVRQLSDAGFAVGVLMAPILPGITDTPESIDETVRAIAATGAASVACAPLGGHGINLAAITAAMAASEDADPDPARPLVAADRAP
jgi:DNA repair photolyase